MKGFVDVALARHQACFAVIDVRQCSESVYLQLEDEVGVVERIAAESWAGGYKVRKRQSDLQCSSFDLGGAMNLEIPDEDLDLIIKALEHYYAYTVARKAEDARYRDLAERLKRKPAEKVAAIAEQVRKGSRRKA